MRDESGKLFYREVQSFGQLWVWLLTLLPAAIFSVGFVQQIILKIPFGGKPMSDTALIIACLLALLGPGSLFIMRLIILVKEDGVYFRFVPFHFSFHKIAFDDIEKFEARTYSPILEYGGWGIRYGGSKGKAYNVKGDKGIQFVLKNSKKVLIGTQNPEDFVKAIDGAISTSDR